MFVKNIVDTSVATLSVVITHDSTTLYTGNVKNVPFYYLNQKVESLSISSSNLAIEI